MADDDKAKKFAEELKDLVGKHFGSLPSSEVEPFGMQLRQVLPYVDSSKGITGTTTTVTLYPTLDTDPPD